MADELDGDVKEWVDVTDADVANTIFGNYGITPASDNLADDSPSHTESGHSLMQRGSDIQFLSTLARRNGKVCRVVCADQPGDSHRLFRQAQSQRRSAAVFAHLERSGKLDGRCARSELGRDAPVVGDRATGAVYRQRSQWRLCRYHRQRAAAAERARLVGFQRAADDRDARGAGRRRRRAVVAGQISAARGGLVHAMRRRSRRRAARCNPASRHDRRSGWSRRSVFRQLPGLECPRTRSPATATR